METSGSTRSASGFLTESCSSALGHTRIQTTNMKTLLLLSILGLALVSAELRTEDHYTEEADVVAVDDSVRRGTSRVKHLAAKFEFGYALTADIKVTQSKADKRKNIAKWTADFRNFDSDICPGGKLNWHVHQYPVSTTASN